MDLPAANFGDGLCGVDGVDDAVLHEGAVLT